MPEFSIPYGRGTLSFTLPQGLAVDRVAPRAVSPAPDPIQAVFEALANPIDGVRLSSFREAKSAAIAINDKTRPVPHAHLLPPLLAGLAALGIPAAKTTLIIATGAHPPMTPEEFPQVVPGEILARYPVRCHDCDDDPNLVVIGETGRGTPVAINRYFQEADLRIVVGNIEPHQFQGFSGGVKSAAIGLAGRATIVHNHALMMEPGARLGLFDLNPARQDVEEIGRILDVHFALNAVLNDKKEVVRVVSGTPESVMRAGMPLARQICQVPVPALYGLLIVSPGGHPKDINVYQAQKGLAHAALVMKKGGTILLAAACPEGSGSRAYEDWARGQSAYTEVIDRFQSEGFRIGPHKAFQIARDAARVNLLTYTDLDPDLARGLLLNPVGDLQAALDTALVDIIPGGRVGVMPLANATIPFLHSQAAPESTLG